MERVAVARAAGVGKAAGDGDAARIVHGNAELAERHLHRGRETGVEVEEVDVVDGDSGVSERRGRRGLDGRRRGEVGTLARRPRVGAAGPAEEDDLTILRDAPAVGLVAAHDDDRGGQVDFHDGVHPLRVGEADPTVVGRRRRDVRRRVGDGEPRVGVLRCHCSVASHEGPEERLMFGDAATGLRPQRVLEQRVAMDRRNEAVPGLDRRGHLALSLEEVAVAFERRPLERAVLLHRSPPAVDALATGEDGDLCVASNDAVGEGVEQFSGRVPPGRDGEAFRRQWHASAFGHACAQVVVTPSKRVDTGKQRRLRRDVVGGCIALAGGVGHGPADRLGHHRRGLPRLERTVELGVATVLADPDDHRLATATSPARLVAHLRRSLPCRPQVRSGEHERLPAVVHRARSQGARLVPHRSHMQGS